MRRYRTFLLPLIAAALIALAYLAPESAKPARDAGTVELDQSSYACPAGSVITVAAGQLSPGTGGSAESLPQRDDVGALGGAQGWRTTVVDGEGVIVAQQGRGSGPVGFFAGTAPKSGGGGLVVGSCPGIVDDEWFLGLGSGNRHFSTLILTNLADAPAVVDLELWGSEGKIDAVGTTGIVVDPFTTKRIPLADVAAGEAEIALRVDRRRGSLAAVVNDSSTAEAGGTEPVSATAAPSKDQVLGGVTQGETGRTLLVLNPGDSTARVAVSVIGPKNTFLLSGLDAVKVPAGSVRVLKVPGSAGSGRQALRLTSDLPVSATMRMAPNDTDYAYAETVPALTGPAVVPVDLGGVAGAPDLVLTAPGRQATIAVEAFDADMTSVGSASVTIKAGTTDHLDTGKEFDGESVAYLVLRPKGQVVAAATYTKGDAISSLAVTTAPVTVLAPQVRPVD